MREDFELWYEGHCAPLEADWFKRDSDYPDDYDYFPAQEAWAGWQASRSALCVELPSKINDQSDKWSNGYDVGIDDAQDALETAGVRYKLPSTSSNS